MGSTVGAGGGQDGVLQERPRRSGAFPPLRPHAMPARLAPAVRRGRAKPCAKRRGPWRTVKSLADKTFPGLAPLRQGPPPLFFRLPPGADEGRASGGAYSRWRGKDRRGEPGGSPDCGRRVDAKTWRASTFRGRGATTSVPRGEAIWGEQNGGEMGANERRWATAAGTGPANRPMLSLQENDDVTPGFLVSAPETLRHGIAGAIRPWHEVPQGTWRG